MLSSHTTKIGCQKHHSNDLKIGRSFVTQYFTSVLCEWFCRTIHCIRVPLWTTSPSIVVADGTCSLLWMNPAMWAKPSNFKSDSCWKRGWAGREPLNTVKGMVWGFICTNLYSKYGCNMVQKVTLALGFSVLRSSCPPPPNVTVSLIQSSDIMVPSTAAWIGTYLICKWCLVQ